MRRMTSRCGELRCGPCPVSTTRGSSTACWKGFPREGWRSFANMATAWRAVYKKPGPWAYWDYRPKPRPANQVAWARTEAIAVALNRMLSHSNPELRLEVLKQMRREQVPASLKAMGRWLKEEGDPGRVAALLDFLGDQPGTDVQQYLEPVIRSPLQRHHQPPDGAGPLRSRDRQGTCQLTPVAVGGTGRRAGPGRSVRSVGKYPQLVAAPLLTGRLDSVKPEVPRRRHRDAGRAAGRGGTGAALAAACGF